jgi:hypothetical protein
VAGWWCMDSLFVCTPCIAEEDLSYIALWSLHEYIVHWQDQGRHHATAMCSVVTNAV